LGKPIQVKSEERFFTTLLNETFEGMGNGLKDSKVILKPPSSRALREKKSIERIYKILKKEDIRCIGLKLIENVSCFRLSIDNKILDFPHNWSLFEELFKSIKSNEDFCYWIDKREDDDLILKILGHWMGEDLAAVIILSKPNPFLAFVPNADKSKFDWIKERVFSCDRNSTTLNSNP
jgi:hypothetical protein